MNSRPSGTYLSDELGDADAEIDVGAVGDVLGDAFRAIWSRLQPISLRHSSRSWVAHSPRDELGLVRRILDPRRPDSDEDAGRDDSLGVDLAGLDDLGRPARPSTWAAIAMSGAKFRAVLL